MLHHDTAGAQDAERARRISVPEYGTVKGYATKLLRTPQPKTLDGAVPPVAVMTASVSTIRRPARRDYSCLARSCRAYGNLAEIKKLGRAHPLLDSELMMTGQGKANLRHPVPFFASARCERGLQKVAQQASRRWRNESPATFAASLTTGPSRFGAAQFLDPEPESNGISERFTLRLQLAFCFSPIEPNQ